MWKLLAAGTVDRQFFRTKRTLRRIIGRQGKFEGAFKFRHVKRSSAAGTVNDDSDTDHFAAFGADEVNGLLTYDRKKEKLPL